MTATDAPVLPSAAGTLLSGEVRRLVGQTAGKYVGLYKHLHSFPELSGRELRTARTVAARLRSLGLRIHEHVGGSGVVGILDNGPGDTVVLRAELDALPCDEATGLEYASTHVAGPSGTGGVMHACGHDVHMAALLGATEVLSMLRPFWSGTLVILFQPEEETGCGALRMVDDGVLELFPPPTVFLAQHVSPMPAGSITLKEGATTAVGTGLRIKLHGTGGHAAFPDHGHNPLSAAARIILRLDELSVRHHGSSIVNVGALHAGTVDNRIPDSADLHVSIRSRSADGQAAVLQAVRDAVALETHGNPAPAELNATGGFPLLVNDPASSARLYHAFHAANLPVYPLGEASWASEDFGVFGAAAQCPSVYWFWGATEPSLFSAADLGALSSGALPDGVPVNHSALFAPSPKPTITSGMTNLVIAALAWFSGGS